jgi:hypothetical protein
MWKEKKTIGVDRKNDERDAISIKEMALGFRD